VSSTGHLIVAGSLLDFTGEKIKVFEIAIQTGAIFAVILVYWQRIRDTVLGLGSQPRAQRFALNVAIAFVPAVLLGLVFGKAIKAHLFTPPVVATTFIVGGFIILWAERRPASTVRVQTVDDMRGLDALKVGLVQCLALIPGTSRSGATIIGGMLFGLSRPAATEFSFFLAIPTLFAACIYDLVRNRALLSADDLQGFAVGFFAAFVSAFVCVRWLIRYVSRHDFVPFAWYRIAFGLVILFTAWSGIVRWD
jgi:undecaprenyl-diphosphatase